MKSATPTVHILLRSSIHSSEQPFNNARGSRVARGSARGAGSVSGPLRLKTIGGLNVVAGELDR